MQQSDGFDPVHALQLINPVKLDFLLRRTSRQAFERRERSDWRFYADLVEFLCALSSSEHGWREYAVMLHKLENAATPL
ncbi:MAG: hypothetical protein EON56_02395, partial [Alphaproteobacteria bacterium]